MKNKPEPTCHGCPEENYANSKRVENDAPKNVQRRSLLASGVSVLAGSALLAQSRPIFAHEPPTTIPPEAQRHAHGKVVGHGDYTYRVDTEWGRLDPKKVPVENCHGLAIDSRGRIIMVTDSDKNNFIVYNKDGKLLDAWGTQYPGAHSVKIHNENGEDFIYIVDCGWVLDRNRPNNEWKNKWYRQTGFVSKLTIDGKLIFTIGHPTTIGIYEPDMRFQPTDVCVGPNGDIYITDGYGSDYVIQYDAKGRYVRHWGGPENPDARYRLKNCHGISVDNRNPAKPHLLVSSRAEQKLKQFSFDGQYLGEIALPGALAGGACFKNGMAYSPVCWSHIDGWQQPNSGFITIFDSNNRVVSNPGGNEPIYKNGELQRMQTSWDVFNHCHTVTVDDDENVYVGQWNAFQTYPIKLERI